MRECVRACARSLRQLSWILFPSRAWRVAHETACVFHALQASSDGRQVRVPVLVPPRCGGPCRCRAFARFTSPSAEEAFQEHVKEVYAPMVLLWFAVWVVIVGAYLVNSEFVTFNSPGAAGPTESVIILDSVRVAFVLPGLIPFLTRHSWSASRYFLFLMLLCMVESASVALRLGMMKNAVMFATAWGQYSVLTKLGPTFLTGLPFMHALAALVIDIAGFSVATWIRSPANVRALLLWNALIGVAGMLYSSISDLQRRREFILKCEISARRHTMEEVAGVYAFLAENTSDLLALHDLPRRDAAAAGAGTESALALASRVVEVRDSRPRFRYVSPASVSSLGWEAEELMSADPFVLIHPEDRGRASLLYRSSPSPEASECEAWERVFAELAGDVPDGAARSTPRDSSSSCRPSRNLRSLLSSLEEARAVSAPPSAVLVGGPPGAVRATEATGAEVRAATAAAASLAPAVVTPDTNGLSTASSRPPRSLRDRLHHLQRLGLSAAAANVDIVLPAELAPGGRASDLSPASALGLPPLSAHRPPSDGDGLAEDDEDDGDNEGGPVRDVEGDVGDRARLDESLHGLGSSDTARERPVESLPASAARIRLEPRESVIELSAWNTVTRTDLRQARSDLHRFLYDESGSDPRMPAAGAPEVVGADSIDVSIPGPAESVPPFSSAGEGPDLPPNPVPVFRRVLPTTLRAGPARAPRSSMLRRYVNRPAAPARPPSFSCSPTVMELRFRCGDGLYHRFQVSGNPTALGLVCVYRRVEES